MHELPGKNRVWRRRTARDANERGNGVPHNNFTGEAGRQKWSNFDLSAVDALDEGVLVIKHPKTLEPTGWTWTFYGPGHAITIELSKRVAGSALKKAAARRQAQADGKKWKEDEERPRSDPDRECRQHRAADEKLHADQARRAVDRVLGRDVD